MGHEETRRIRMYTYMNIYVYTNIYMIYTNVYVNKYATCMRRLGELEDVGVTHISRKLPVGNT